MHEMLDQDLAETESPFPEMRLLIAPEPWFRSFVQNLRDLFSTANGVRLHLQYCGADFWPDVFVERSLPWRRFFESGGYHILAIVMIWAGSHFVALQPRVTSLPTFKHDDVV